jgi:hypothetical protein
MIHIISRQSIIAAGILLCLATTQARVDKAALRQFLQKQIRLIKSFY